MLQRASVQPSIAAESEDKKHRKAYTHEFKLEVARYYQNSTLKATKRWLETNYPEHKDLSVAQISRWAKHLATIEASGGSRKRIKRGSLKNPQNLQEESEIVEPFEDTTANEPLEQQQSPEQDLTEVVLANQLQTEANAPIERAPAAPATKAEALEAMQKVQDFLHRCTLVEQKRDKAYKHWLALNRILRLATAERSSQSTTASFTT